MKTTLSRNETAELYNLYHLARTALARSSPSRYDRKIWATNEFIKAHPGDHSHTSVYLTFERADAGLIP